MGKRRISQRLPVVNVGESINKVMGAVTAGFEEGIQSGMAAGIRDGLKSGQITSVEVLVEKLNEFMDENGDFNAKFLDIMQETLAVDKDGLDALKNAELQDRIVADAEEEDRVIKDTSSSEDGEATKFGEIFKNHGGLVSTIVGGIGVGLLGLAAFATDWGKIFKSEQWNGLKNVWVDEILPMMNEVVSDIVVIWQDFSKSMPGFFDKMVKVWTSSVLTVLEIFKDISLWFVSSVQMIKNIFKADSWADKALIGLTLLQVLGDTILNIFGALLKHLGVFFGVTFDDIADFVTKMITGFQENVYKSFDIMKEFFTNENPISKMFNDTMSMLKDIAGAGFDLFLDGIKAVLLFPVTTMKWLFDRVTKMVVDIKDTFVEWADTTKTDFTNLFTGDDPIWVRVKKFFVDGVTNFIDMIIGWFKDIIRVLPGGEHLIPDSLLNAEEIKQQELNKRYDEQKKFWMNDADEVILKDQIHDQYMREQSSLKDTIRPDVSRYENQAGALKEKTDIVEEIKKESVARNNVSTIVGGSTVDSSTNVSTTNHYTALGVGDRDNTSGSLKNVTGMMGIA